MQDVWLLSCSLHSDKRLFVNLDQMGLFPHVTVTHNGFLFCSTTFPSRLSLFIYFILNLFVLVVQPCFCPLLSFFVLSVCLCANKYSKGADQKPSPFLRSPVWKGLPLLLLLGFFFWLHGLPFVWLSFRVPL